MNTATLTVYIGPGPGDGDEDDAIVLLPTDLEGTPEGNEVLEEIAMADVDWFGWITLNDDVPCPHENWFVHQDDDGTVWHVCEDCDDSIRESDIDKSVGLIP